MKTASQLLAIKGNQVLSIAPNSDVYEALVMMEKHHVGALLVLDAEKLVGIFSERHYARNVALKGKSSKNTLISEVMTSKVISISPYKTLEDCMSIMTEKRIRHLPVLEKDNVIGVLSIGDLMKETLIHQQSLIKQLKFQAKYANIK
jgi:CBS domain-containing protein